MVVCFDFNLPACVYAAEIFGESKFLVSPQTVKAVRRYLQINPFGVQDYYESTSVVLSAEVKRRRIDE